MPHAADDTRDFRARLIADRVVGPDAVLTPLTGGVSSEICRVDDRGRTFVVKRALARLRVRDEWLADVSRNDHELAYLRVVERIAPGLTPRVIDTPGRRGYFAMEFLGDGFDNWKQLLLRGDCRPAHAAAAGAALGTIHANTWDNAELHRQFDTTPHFHQLRTAPYLLTTAARHPALRSVIEAEARRLESTRRALVHGDFSPKNILLAPGRLVLLDCEVAWFGDPSFDVAFLLNHLLLKSLHLPARRATLLELAHAAWDAYRDKLGPRRTATVEAPLPILLPLLMLARVDGKSPVEYLSPAHGEAVRTFASAQLLSSQASLGLVFERWGRFLQESSA